MLTASTEPRTSLKSATGATTSLRRHPVPRRGVRVDDRDQLRAGKIAYFCAWNRPRYPTPMTAVRTSCMGAMILNAGYCGSCVLHAGFHQWAPGETSAGWSRRCCSARCCCRFSSTTRAWRRSAPTPWGPTRLLRRFPGGPCAAAPVGVVAAARACGPRPRLAACRAVSLGWRELVARAGIEEEPWRL